MHKLVLTTLFVTGIFFSCGNPAVDANKTDTTHNKHGISVTNPLDAERHAVKDSIYNGTHIERYDNGVIYMRGDVLGGLRAGEWLTFYKSGKEWSRGTYKDGLRQGYGISYWENGQKSSEGYYKDDKMVGKWKFWDAYGTVAEKDFGGQ